MANIRLYCNKFTINNTDVVLIKSEGIKIKIYVFHGCVMREKSSGYNFL